MAPFFCFVFVLLPRVDLPIAIAALSIVMAKHPLTMASLSTRLSIARLSESG